MENSEALKDCLRQLLKVSPEEDTIPLEIILQGITLQQEFIKLIKKKSSKPEQIEEIRTRLGLFQDLVNVQKATRATMQQFLGSSGAGDEAPVNYHGMGIKKMMEKKHKKDGENL